MSHDRAALAPARDLCNCTERCGVSPRITCAGAGGAGAGVGLSRFCTPPVGWLHTRGLDHQEDREKDDKTKAMVRPTSVYHQGRECEVDYSKSVVSTHNDPLTRKIRNGVAIISNQQDILLNNKQEFQQGAVPSTQVQRVFSRFKPQSPLQSIYSVSHK